MGIQPIKAGVGAIVFAGVSPQKTGGCGGGGPGVFLVLLPCSPKLLGERLVTGAVALERFFPLPDILHR